MVSLVGKHRADNRLIHRVGIFSRSIFFRDDIARDFRDLFRDTVSNAFRSRVTSRVKSHSSIPMLSSFAYAPASERCSGALARKSSKLTGMIDQPVALFFAASLRAVSSAAKLAGFSVPDALNKWPSADTIAGISSGPKS